jgi:ethanolamine utilization protein EutA
MKNLPTAAVEAEQPTAEQIRQALSRQEGEAVVLALPGSSSPHYEQVAALADAVAAGFEGRPVLVALRQDMAKALGHALALRLPGEKPILCIDSIHLTADSYLDVGAPIGPALPVVVKTLILSN